MNRMLNVVWRILLTAALAMGIFAAGAVTADAAGQNQASGLVTETGIFAYIPVSDTVSQNVNIVTVGGKDYLFLPACVSPKAVYFHYDTGKNTISLYKDGAEAALASDTAADLTPYLSAENEDGSKTLTLHVTAASGSVTERNVYVMNSSKISSIYLTSESAEKGRSYVDASKSNKAKGSMVMLTGDGSLVYAGGLKQIKGRGNTTFGAEKKPYQIKLASDTNLVRTGSGADAASTWVLLANAYDPTLIHNTVGYRMAKSMGLDVPDCESVDLYYDGMYRGTYLLTEKVEVGSGRVAIADLEKKTEKANSGKDTDKCATAMGANKYGDIFQYVTGVADPGNIEGGYLIEQDDAYYKSERSYFVTSVGTPFVVKSPENCSKEEMEFISDYVEEMIRAAVNGGTEPDNGKSVWEYIDKTSLTKYFVLQEITKNADAFSSSAYMYLDNDGMPMTVGPVWDLDDSYGIRSDKASAEGFACGGGYIQYFMNLADFRSSVRSYYSSTGYSKAVNAGIDTAAAEIASSQKMNRVLWDSSSQMYQKLESYDADLAYMKNFASARAKWLKGVLAAW